MNHEYQTIGNFFHPQYLIPEDITNYCRRWYSGQHYERGLSHDAAAKLPRNKMELNRWMVTEIRWSRCAVPLASPVPSAIRRPISSRKERTRSFIGPNVDRRSEARCIWELHVLHNLALWPLPQSQTWFESIRCCNGVDNRHVPLWGFFRPAIEWACSHQVVYCQSSTAAPPPPGKRKKERKKR